MSTTAPIPAPAGPDTIAAVLAIPEHQVLPVLAYVAARHPATLAEALRAFGMGA